MQIPFSPESPRGVDIETGAATTTIFSEDFSGGYPGAWYIGHDGAGGAYAWAWPYDYAHEYADPNGSMYYYPDNLHVYMERRALSLAGYDSATLAFDKIVDTEAGYDKFTVNVRDQDGDWHTLYVESGITDPLVFSRVEISLDTFVGQSGLYIQFRFDSDGSISGSPYDGVFIDNVILTASTSLPPDLIISASSLGDSIVFPRDTLDAYATVRNDGSATAGSSYLAYYLSRDASPNASEFIDDDYVPSLGPGASSSERHSFTVPDLDPSNAANFGTWNVIFEADVYDDVYEGSAEINNVAARAVTITRPTLSNFTTNTFAANAGDTIVLNYYINNPDSTQRTIGLGASIREAGTSTWINDPANDITVSVPPGSSWHSRSFTIPISAIGTYDVAWGLHSGVPGTSTYLYDYRERNSYLTVLNSPPTLVLTEPSSDLAVTQGAAVTIQWNDSDPDDNAYISLAYDIDSSPTNDSGHSWIALMLPEDPDSSGDRYTWTTDAIPDGTYYIWGMITDNKHAETYSLAPGRVTVQPAPGSIRVKVHNVQNNPWQGAEVLLYDADWSEPPLGTHYSGSDGIVPPFTGLEPGNYHIEVWHTPSGQTPAARELWGSMAVTVASGVETEVDFHRSWPTIDFQDPEPVGLPAAGVISGGQASIDIKVANPIGGSYTARVSVVLDRDMSPPYDVPEYACSPASQSVTGSTQVTFNCDSPILYETGTYHVYYRIEALAPSGWVATDQNDWGAAFVVLPAVTLDGYELVPARPSVAPGESFAVRYFLTNPTPYDAFVYLLARSRSPEGVYQFLEDGTGESAVPVTVSPGSAWYEREAVVYGDAPQGNGYGLTWIVSPTVNWGDYIASASDWDAFDVIHNHATPAVTAYISNSGLQEILYQTVTYQPSGSASAVDYEIRVLIDAAVPLAWPTPLSEYAGKIYGISVIDASTLIEVDADLARQILLDVENRLLLSRTSSFHGSSEAAVPNAYVGVSGGRADNDGGYYPIRSSLVSSALNEKLIYRGFRGLDNPSARQAAYEIVLLELILNLEMNEEDLYEKLATSWGASKEAISFLNEALKVPTLVKDGDTGTNPFYAIDRLEQSVDVAIVKSNLAKAGTALELMSTGASVASDIYEMLLLQALISAESELRLHTLEQLINGGLLQGQDYLLDDALAAVRSDYYDIDDNIWIQYRTAFSSGSLLTDLQKMREYIEAGWWLGTHAKWLAPESLELFKGGHAAAAPKGHNFPTPATLAIQAIWQTSVTLDGKLSLIREADLACILSYQMENYLETAKAFPGVVDGDDTQLVMMTNNLRRYLGAIHFRRLHQSLDSKGYGFLLLDVVDGLLTWYSYFYPDYNTARDDYYAQYERNERAYIETAPPYFLLNAGGKFEPLLRALTRGSSDEKIPVPSAMTIGNLEQRVLLFHLDNTGNVDANPYYITVSMSSGLEVIEPAASSDVWTRYEIGDDIYYRTGTPNPRPSNMLMYEASGVLSPGSVVEHALTIIGAQTGDQRLYYRAAALPDGVLDEQDNYERDPLSSSVEDQQGWPAKHIDIIVGDPPIPKVTANISSLDLELGGQELVLFTLENQGGNSAPAYIDVSVSDGLEILESFPLYAWDRYEPGDEIWHAGEAVPRPGTNLLYSSVQPLLPGGSTRLFALMVHGKSAGNQWIKFRAAMNPEGVDPNDPTEDTFYRDPASGDLDQQGWPAYTIPVNVWVNHSPIIDSASPGMDLLRVSPGDTLTFSISVSDADSQSTLDYVWVLDGFTIQEVATTSMQWTPGGDDLGARTLSVFVRDGELFASRTWEIQVVDATLCYPLTLSAVGEGARPIPNPDRSEGCGEGEYVAGEAITLVASAEPLYEVSSWAGTVDDLSASDANTVVMPAGPHAAAVTYTRIPPIFADVGESHWARDYIEVLYIEGYTAGCATAPLMYCPDATMIRAESAVFVERGIHGTDHVPDDPLVQTFDDVPTDYWGANWIEGLWLDGYTAGCSATPLLYCPFREHTRVEGAVFYERMLHGKGYVPPAPIGIFADVPVNWWGAKWAEAAYADGLIIPCQTSPELLFCPNDPLDRAMAAYMMVQAKNLALP